MKKIIIAAAALAALPALGEVTLYGREDFRGRSITIPEDARNLERTSFGSRASSAIVRVRPYELCDDRGYGGRCVVLQPGRYPSLAQIGLDNAVMSVRVAAAPPAPLAEITLFGRDGFQGRQLNANEPLPNLERHDFDDRASSAIVRGGPFEICDQRGFQGRCRVLRPGQYPSLAAMGMDDAVSSVRPVGRAVAIEERRFAPPPPVAYDYRRRAEERLYEADVVAVRAVYGRPEERCWIEREQVNAPSNEANIGGAVIGGIIGGILGHQVGSGRGNDAATAGGAIAGALIGNNVAGGGNPFGTTYSRDVQRCAPSQARGRPEFWDVRYRFRGMERTVQMARPPGPTITVNADGEPRA